MANDFELNNSKLRGQNRIRLLAIIFCTFFLMIVVQLGRLTLLHKSETSVAELVHRDLPLPRPDIVDRDGVVMATDIAVSSLYSDPRKITDIDEAVELLTATLPELDAKTLITVIGYCLISDWWWQS